MFKHFHQYKDENDISIQINDTERWGNYGRTASGAGAARADRRGTARAEAHSPRKAGRAAGCGQGPVPAGAL